MKKSLLRTVILAMFLAAAAFSMTSCNKGYGCPTNFSLDMPVPSISILK